MNTQDAIRIASEHIVNFSGHTFDVVDVSKPISTNAAVFLSKVISKLSPLVGNLIEFNIAEFLNGKDEFAPWGKWVRQDPGFPDTIFEGRVVPTPGFEIKAWFPLGTEITARFKDSQNHFRQDQTYVVLLAWLPENLIYGKPRILDVCIVSGMSVAVARDTHYHNPPDYIVLEPEDTTARTINLQQSNNNGFKFQGTPEEFRRAQELVAQWGASDRTYSPSREYQALLRQLIARFKYRLDTNFAKMDRIEHSGIEEFKKRVYGTNVHGMTVRQWNRVLFASSETILSQALQEQLNIKDETEELID
jgi:hypothetical protein